MYSDIIIGFDGSLASRDAVALGRRLARATGARPTVIYVRSPKPVTGEIPEVPDDDTWGASVATTLDEARAMLADVPTATFRGVAETSVAQVLHWAAEAADAALIVLGATHRCGVGRLIPARRPTPCCMRHLAPSRSLRSDTPTGRSRRPSASSPRPSTAEGRASAWHTSPRASPGAPGRLCVSSRWSIRGTWATHPSTSSFANPRPRSSNASRPGVEIELRPEAGDVEDGVARTADGVDLLVIGSRGHGPLRRVLHGGATTKILQAVACPVIVVPRRTTEQRDDAVVPLAATVTGTVTGR